VDLVCEAHISIFWHMIGTCFYVLVGFCMWTHVEPVSLCGPSLLMMMYQ
jgi:hypothetical protein